MSIIVYHIILCIHANGITHTMQYLSFTPPNSDSSIVSIYSRKWWHERGAFSMVRFWPRWQLWIQSNQLNSYELTAPTIAKKTSKNIPSFDAEMYTRKQFKKTVKIGKLHEFITFDDPFSPHIIPPKRNLTSASGKHLIRYDNISTSHSPSEMMHEKE